MPADWAKTYIRARTHFTSRGCESVCTSRHPGSGIHIRAEGKKEEQHEKHMLAPGANCTSSPAAQPGGRVGELEQRDSFTRARSYCSRARTHFISRGCESVCTSRHPGSGIHIRAEGKREEQHEKHMLAPGTNCTSRRKGRVDTPAFTSANGSLPSPGGVPASRGNAIPGPRTGLLKQRGKRAGSLHDSSPRAGGQRWIKRRCSDFLQINFHNFA